MKPSAAIKYYETQTALAAALQVTQPCVANWKARGKIPDDQQFKLHRLTNGALKADRRVLQKYHTGD